MDLQEMKKQNKRLIQEILDAEKELKQLRTQLTTLTICQKIRRRKQKKLVRNIYIAEGKVKVLSYKGKRKYQKKTKTDIEISLEELSAYDQAEMLEHLLAIRKERQKSQNEKNSLTTVCKMG